MKQCPNCHNEIPESAKVCGHCGTRLANTGKVFCIHCGKEIPTTAKMCGYCGTRQEETAADAPALKRETSQVNTVEPKPAPKADLPRWVIPVAAVAVLAAIAGTVLLMRPKGAPQAQPPVQQAQKAAAPANASPVNTPTSTAQSAAPVQANADAYYVGYSCQNETVPANTPIRVTYGWMATTPEQVADYFKAVEHKIMVDGKAVGILGLGFDALTTSKEGYPFQKIWMDIGSLQPGAHEIRSLVNVTNKVTDGQDWYGPGTGTESFERVCTVMAKDIGSETACNFAKFVSETIPDKTIIAPGKSFTKSWTLMNTGSCAWSADYQLVYTGGDQLGSPTSVAINKSVGPGEQVTIEVPFTAPKEPGLYTSNWKLQSRSGVNFFQVYMTIEVK
jgi:hypothetical protein